jgi:hypothetical protein
VCVKKFLCYCGTLCKWGCLRSSIWRGIPLGDSALITDLSLVGTFILSASSRWLILSCSRGGMPKTLALCWDESIYRCRRCIRKLLYVTSSITLYSRFPLPFQDNRGTKVTTHRAPYVLQAVIRWGAATRCPKGTLSLPQCHAARGTIPWRRWTRALFAFRRHHPSTKRSPRVGWGGGGGMWRK